MRICFDLVRRGQGSLLLIMGKGEQLIPQHLLHTFGLVKSILTVWFDKSQAIWLFTVWFGKS
jgi:hypothetical protein